MRSQDKLRLATLALLMAAIGGAVWWMPIGSYLDGFARAIRGLGLWGPVALVVAYVLAAVLFVPGLPLTLIAGFLFGVVEGTLLVWFASLAGASAAFWLGRSAARDWTRRKIASSPRFRAIDAAVERQGLKIVLLIRLSPVFPYAFTNYAMSLTTIRFRDFLLASAIGMLPGTIVYVYLGSTAEGIAQIAAGTYQGSKAQAILFALGLLATLAATIAVTRAARSAMRDAAD